MDTIGKIVEKLKQEKTKKKDGSVAQKEKTTLCQQVTEGILSVPVKDRQTTEFGKIFSSSFETLFSLCDDAHSDVRIVAEECITSIIRNSLAEGNATRVHIELYKEMKRKGSPARCLRSALTKFAELADQIRPQKCRMFAVNLVSCLTDVATTRHQDLIYECFGVACSKIFAALGQYFSDEETKILMNSIIPNLQLASAPARRAASTFLVDLCRYTRKKQFFTAWLLKKLLDPFNNSSQGEPNVNQIVGNLTALRLLTTLIKECDDNNTGEVRVVQTGAVRVNAQLSVTLDQLLQLFGITLYYICSPNNPVATCALETLSAYLQNLPRRLMKILLADGASENSRIPWLNFNGFNPNWKSLMRKTSVGGTSSGFSSARGSQTNLTMLPDFMPLEPEDNPLLSVINVDLSDVSPGNSTAAISPPVEQQNEGENLFTSESNNNENNLFPPSEDEDDENDDEEKKMYKNETAQIRRVFELQGLGAASDDLIQSSEPSTPMSENTSQQIVVLPDDIGSLEKDSPSKYCCRLLCRKFLLSNEIGGLIADKDVRVSQKVLALNCVESLCSLDPSLIDLTLIYSSEFLVDNCQKIDDVFLYSSHSDHLLRGETACFVGSWLKSAYVCGRYNSSESFSKVDSFRHSIEVSFADQHFLAARSSLLALKSCQNELLAWIDVIRQDLVLKIFNAALSTLRHTYWTVKLALLDVWSNLNFSLLRRCELQCELESLHKTNDSYQNRVLNVIVNDLLSDENGRVRQEAASTLISLVKSLCFVDVWDTTKFARYFERGGRTSLEFTWFHRSFPKIQNLAAAFDVRCPKQLTSWQEENLSHLVALLYRTLATTKDQFHLAGCLTALAKLSETYKPSQYYQCWSTILTEQDFGAPHLTSLFQYASTITGTETIAVHQVLLTLLANLFAGYASRQILKQNSATTTTNDRWPILASQNLSEFATDLNLYCYRILSIYWHVCSEVVPAPPPMIAKPPLPQLTQQSLPPVAQKIIKRQQNEKNDASNQPIQQVQNLKTKIGDFHNIPYLMRLYEMIKGGWTNYRITLDADVTERFVGLLRSCLQCLSTLLEVASLIDVEKTYEEILFYVKPLMSVLPADVVDTVTQILKALFGTNLSLLVRPDSGAIAGVPSSNSYLSVFNVPSSLYQLCVVKPRTKFAQSMAASVARHDLLNDALNNHLGWFGSRADKHVVNLLKQPAHKEMLMNYIRNFEPCVVQALRFYSSSVGIDLQRAVISLLLQLVQIRVHYRRLDNDLRFLNFLFQQLETAEEGIVLNVAKLVPTLFEYFIILSYEKYDNQSVLSVPKILQLADSLLASGLNQSLGISALHSVVLDLFLLRPNAKLEPPKELEIQQECVISVLMKSLNCVEALDLFTFVLYRTRRENEAKWRKLSRDVVDVLLPMLSKGQFPFNNFESFVTVLKFLDFLCPSAFRPVDAVLELLFSSPANSCTEIERLCKWLSVEYVCLHALVLYCKEDAILSRLEVNPLTLKFNCRTCENFRTGVPPWSSVATDSSTPQDVFAEVLLTICDLVFHEMNFYCRCLPQNAEINFLEALILRYLQLLTHVCQNGAFRKVSSSLASHFVRRKWTSDVVSVVLINRCPHIVVQFFYLLSSLHVYNDEFWQKFVSDEFKNNVILRQIILILYTDYVKAQILTGEYDSNGCKCDFDGVVELLDEPPVSELISVVQKNYTASRSYFCAVEKHLFQSKPMPNQCVKLLRSLEFLHYNLSLDSVYFFVRCLDSTSYVVVRNVAASLACRKTELILINRSTSADTLKFSDEQYQFVVGKLNSPKLSKFVQLRNLVVKLTVPALSPSINENDDDVCLLLQNSRCKLKKPKFIQLLQAVVHRRCVKSKNVAQILHSVNVDEAAELLSDWAVTGDLLEVCILHDKIADASEELPSPAAVSPRADENLSPSSVSLAAVRALLDGVRTLFLKIPKEIRVDFDFTSFEIETTTIVALREISVRLLDYSSAVRVLLDNSQLVKTLTDNDVQTLTKFCYYLILTVLSVETDVTLIQTLNACSCLISCFNCERTCSYLNSNDLTKIQMNLIGAVFWILIKIYKFSDVLSLNQENVEIIGVEKIRSVIWSYVRLMLVWLESQKLDFNKTSNELFTSTKRLIIGISRLPYVCSFSRVPVSIFKYGWVPEVKRSENGSVSLPTVPVRFLQNVDSLRDFMFRVNLLGWSNRQDFEEIWMGLLGVLSATPIGQELQCNSAQVQEITNRVCASTVAVRCLTSLLLQTLLYPVPGNPLASKYISRQREKQSAFLKSTSGQRLMDLKRRISRPTFEIPISARSSSSSYGRNIERLHNVSEYSVAQFSVDTLWFLTGILAEEKNLLNVGGTNPAGTLPNPIAPPPVISVDSISNVDDQRVVYNEEPPPGVVIQRSASNYILTSENDLNMASCLHFLLDLFGHWLTNGADAVPLPLLSTTVECVVLLSDLFTERSQYEWLREKLLSVYQQRSSEDELIVQDLILGVLKSSAVLGMNDVEKEKETLNFIDSGLKQRELSVRIATLHGALYVLQTMTSDEIVGLMPVLSDYSLGYMNACVGNAVENDAKLQSVDHQLVLFALGFYIVESFHDPHTKQSFSPKFLEICVKVLNNRSLSSVLIKAVTSGIESLLINSSLEVKTLGQLAKLATENIQQADSSELVTLSVQLLLTCLYSVKENRRSDELTSPESEMAPRNAGEPTLSAMERLSVLLNRITKGNLQEASVIGKILPSFLSDNFSPGDVMNKIITELLHPSQPHPEIVIRILHSLIEALLRHEATTVVCDWILLSMPSFTHKNPWQFAVWCLTCVLLSASSNCYVKDLWYVVQSRLGQMEKLDKSLFCLAVENFCSQLKERSQLESFLLTMNDASNRNPTSVYCNARDIISNYYNLPTSTS